MLLKRSKSHRMNLTTWQRKCKLDTAPKSVTKSGKTFVPPIAFHQPSRQPSPRKDRFKDTFGVSRKPQDLANTPNIAIVQSVTPPTFHEVTRMCRFINNLAQAKQGVVQVPDGAGRKVFIEGVEDPHRRTDTVHLITLLDTGTNIGRPQTLALSRKQRFAIAAAATWAVLYLCGLPWLDSDWNGKDILRLFLEESQNTDSPSLQADYPSISQLFKPVSQRPSTQSAAAAENFQNSQVRNRTLFNLGILLIELCLNNTPDQLRQELQANNFAASPGVKMPLPSDFEVANRLTEKIYLEAGDSYGYAVQRCLRCEFPGCDITKDFEFQGFRRQFFNGVVAPIQAIFEMQSASLLDH
ncbi:hypothetical protein FGRMN_1716 [Fusarium graminum]|nr:hypothetical protein FGRMN_1716 [Fusarium graminum]